MNKHLSETLVAAGITILLSTVGITATHASVNAEKTVASVNIDRDTSSSHINDTEKPITASSQDISFASTNISSSVTADAKAKIGFSSVSVTSIPKPKPTPPPKPVVAEPEKEAVAPEIEDKAINAPAIATPKTVELPQDLNAYQKYAGEELARRGMGAAELTCLIPLWTKESGWNPNAANPASSARGIPQMMMGVHYGADWATNARGTEYLSNPNVQINVGLDYIQGRYQTPCNALSIWQTQSWY